MAEFFFVEVTLSPWIP